MKLKKKIEWQHLAGEDHLSEQEVSICGNLNFLFVLYSILRSG